MQYSKELNPNEILIIDGSEQAKRSALTKHVTSMIEYIKTTQGFYKLNINLLVVVDNITYNIKADEDSYQITSTIDENLPSVLKDSELSHLNNSEIVNKITETVTLMRGQRYTLPISSKYKHITYKTKEVDWYKFTLDTITPIKTGIFTLDLIINNIPYEKTFVIVEQPEYVGDVNNIDSISWEYKNDIASNIITQSEIIEKEVEGKVNE